MRPKAEAGTYAVLAVGLAVLVACAGGVATVSAPKASETPMASAQLTQVAAARPLGFLDPTTMPSAIATIPPAPKEGEMRNTLDWEIFVKTRALEGSERWKLAQADDSYRPSDLLKNFSCALGVQLTPENAPALAGILAKTTIDAGLAAEAAKQLYRRTRPFMHNPGNICIARTPGLEASFDYPSGHGSLGWIAGLVVAQLAPERASAALARGRAFGESRVVCGLHNMSAIEAARTNAAGVFAAVQASPDYRDALARARTELEAARTSAAVPDAAWCAKEAELVKPLAVN
ncbi:MAG: acid phosphatase [Hyphomonadaceae bacterium]